MCGISGIKIEKTFWFMFSVRRPSGFAIRYRKCSTDKTWGFAIPLSETIYIFLIAKNLHDSKISRIFAAKDRNRRKDYGKQ